jgi:hypothetical protein
MVGISCTEKSFVGESASILFGESNPKPVVGRVWQQQMAQRLRGVGNRQPAPILIPPQGFLTVESNIHRGLSPILPEHLPFLKRLKLGLSSLCDHVMTHPILIVPS